MGVWGEHKTEPQQYAHAMPRHQNQGAFMYSQVQPGTTLVQGSDSTWRQRQRATGLSGCRNDQIQAGAKQAGSKHAGSYNCHPTDSCQAGWGFGTLTLNLPEPLLPPTSSASATNMSGCIALMTSMYRSGVTWIQTQCANISSRECGNLHVCTDDYDLAQGGLG